MTDNQNRAIDMENEAGKKVTKEEYLKILKEDWNERGKSNPDLYVWARQEFSQKEWELSGKEDFNKYFEPVYNFYRGRADRIWCFTLEIGCGIGRMTRPISQIINPTFLFALDISDVLIQRAKQLLPKESYPNISFVEGKGNNIPISNNFIDFAFEYIVFQHIPFPSIIDDYIKELNRVLSKGGIFVGHFKDTGPTPSDITDGNTWHGCKYGLEEVSRALVDTSLRIVKVEGGNTADCWIHLEKN